MHQPSDLEPRSAVASPFTRSPRAAAEVRLWSWLSKLVLGMVLAVLLLFVTAIALTRFWLVPNADGLRPHVVERLSRLSGQRVALGSLQAAWNGWSPEFRVERLQVLDTAGRVLLELPRVDAALSWRSLFALEPRLAALTVYEPRLLVRRTSENGILIAGFGVDLAASGGDTGIADWLLRQRQVQIVRGEVEWVDEWRKLPPLKLKTVSAKLLSRGSHHRAGIVATPVLPGAAGAPAKPIDLRADFHARSARSIADWDGTLFARILDADLASWARYLPLPVEIAAGRGSVQAWFEIDDGAPVALTADIGLSDARVRLAQAVRSQVHPESLSAVRPMELVQLKGRISWRERRVAADRIEQRWSLREVELEPVRSRSTGVMSGELHLSGVLRSDGVRQWEQVGGLADRIDLTAFTEMLESLPLPHTWRERLQKLEPRGEIARLEWAADLHEEPVLLQRLQADLNGVGWNAVELIPGIRGFQGRLELEGDAGRLRLGVGEVDEAARQLAAARQRILGGKGGGRLPPAAAAPGALVLDMPKVFAERLELTRLSGEVRWQTETIEHEGKRQRKLSHVDLDAIRFANVDTSGEIRGRWQPDKLGPGVADLSGSLGSARADRIYRYLPLVVGEDTRRWLQLALLSGTAEDTRFKLKGALWHYPFRQAQEGEFEVNTQVRDVTIDYADHWPKAEHVYGELSFRGPGMLAKVQRGILAGTPVGPLEVKIDDMGRDDATVDIRGGVQADLAALLAFSEQSPLVDLLGGFTRGARGSGPSRLKLDLAIPLHPPQARLRVQGELGLEAVKLELGGELPPLEAVRGRLVFTETKLGSAGPISANALGGPVNLELASEGGRLKVNAQGRSQLPEVARQYPYPLLDRLQGEADWTLSMNAPLTAQEQGRQGPYLDITARARVARWPLDEIITTQPARSERTAMPFKLTRQVRRDGGDLLDLQLGEQVLLRSERSAVDGRGERRIERAAVDIGSERPPLPSRGYALRGEALRIDMDAALALWSGTSVQAASVIGRPAEGSASQQAININLRAREMVAFGHVFNEASLRAQPSGQRWRLAVRSQEATGAVTVDSASSGEVEAVAMRFTRLILPKPYRVDTASRSSATQSALPGRWPRLDVQAEQFLTAGGVDWGRLELKAQPGGREWRIDQLKITSPEGSIEGQGSWLLADGTPTGDHTHLKLKLHWQDAGRFLGRIGLPTGVERGAGSIEGHFDWRGSPADFSHHTATGEFRLRTSEGRFTQMEPGIGKLLGILSLQSLPRRLSLNFEDLFGRGHAFDSIEALVKIQRGVASTEGFQVTGPSARVEIRGTADIEKETQSLKVRVYPSLSVATAIGIGIVTANPAIGAAAFLGQKLTRDPIERMLMQEFEVSGTWTEPSIKSTTVVANPAPAAPN